MGNEVPWKTGMLIYLPVTSRPLISLQKEAVSSPCNFATTHLTACILDFYLPSTSQPLKRRTLSQRPSSELNFPSFVMFLPGGLPRTCRCKLCAIFLAHLNFPMTLGLGKRGLFRKVHFLEILENFEILEILEKRQTVENKGESGHFPEILENLEIVEILEISPVKKNPLVL